MDVFAGLTASTAFAQLSGGQYTLTRSTVVGGGGVSTGGQFSLSGTIVQADAAPQPATGGVVLLSGGF